MKASKSLRPQRRNRRLPAQDHVAEHPVRQCARCQTDRDRRRRPQRAQPATADVNAGNALKAKVLATLDESRTAFKVNDAKYVSNVLAGGLAGALIANQQAVFGAVGSFDAKVIGLDELLASLSAKTAAGQQANATTEAIAAAQKAQGTTMMLSMVKTFGRKVPDTKASTFTYKFEIGADGSLKVNGNDMGGLIGGMGGPHKSRALQ